jgi:hypothetical protein
VYEEVMHLHVADGMIESLDLREFDLAARGNERAKPNIRLRSREMPERRVAVSELADVRLKERPRDVTIINEMIVSPGATPTCRGVMWLSFQGTTFQWPQPFDIEVRGVARLPLGANSVPFVAPMRKNVKVSELQLPAFGLFASNALLTKKDAEVEVENSKYEVYEPTGTSAVAGQLNVRSELVPANALFRNPWVSAQRHLFFPVGWPLALAYLFLSSFVSEVLFKKPL